MNWQQSSDVTTGTGSVESPLLHHLGPADFTHESPLMSIGENAFALQFVQ
jgi:hypothetical protein